MLQEFRCRQFTNLGQHAVVCTYGITKVITVSMVTTSLAVLQHDPITLQRVEFGANFKILKMTSEILTFVTGNANKLREVEEILAAGGVPLIIQSRSIDCE
ncbi:hypothetical protein AG1IA_00166 [Rhizoctonia solani AG-1 IA]|uniref:Uncharacterized protein n=1 Tax=Thanatephorus cucumeris (strain AG1-IA) TaxID=983506 RepID=L8X9P6_THACA|nr:hypothetical protein AG1IA_00166 [Rhizoctonia solani AG-1 IA]